MRASQQRIDFVVEFVDGWRELIRHRGLFDLTLVLAIVTLLYMPLNALFPLMTFSHFSGDAAAASYVEVAFGAGMLVGSMAIGVMSQRFSGVQLIGAGILLVAACLQPRACSRHPHSGSSWCCAS